MSVLYVEDLSIQFHDRHANGETVKHVNFHIDQGEIVGIVGESGSGKSTAMQAIMGLLPQKAEIKCKDMLLAGEKIIPPSFEGGKPEKTSQKIYERKMQAIRGSQVAMIFQDPLTYLNPTVKIEKQVTEAIHAHKKMTRARAKERAIELLDMVGIRNPKERLKQYPFELSGGMCQRVVIAIAIACEPKLLIADEPTTALDVTVQGQILQVLLRIAKETKTAVLIVSHDLGVIASVCSRVMVMQSGHMIESGTVEEIFYEPTKQYTRTLIAQASDLGNLAKPRDLSGTETPLLSLRNVTKRYPGKTSQSRTISTEAVKAVSLDIYKGETYGLVGESGCGKTTLASMITGVQVPTSGILEYGGRTLVGMKRHIQMVFQNPYASLNPRRTIGETLEEPLLLNTEDNVEKRREKMIKMMGLVGLLTEDLNKYPQAFSGGQRQRIGIARALMLQPELIVCDEPVSALDLSIQEQILRLLEEIQSQFNLSYLFISHDLNVVKRISQRMGVMYAGSIVEEGNTQDVYEEPWHPYTKTLLSAMLTSDPRKARKRRGMAMTSEQRQEDEKKGCPFVTRCGYAMACCEKRCPEMYLFHNRKVACFLYSNEHTGNRSSQYKMTSQI